MIKVAIYSRLARDQRVRVFDADEVTIGTHAAADVTLPPAPDGAHHEVSLSVSQEGEIVLVPRRGVVLVGALAIPLDQPVVVRKSDVVCLADHRIYVRRTLELLDPGADAATEAMFVARVRRSPGSDPLRLVFADWLEERGDRARADYLRAQHAFASLGIATAEATALAAARVRELAVEVDARFRALTAVQLVENCNLAFQVACPRQWTDLQATDSEDVRSCDACKKSVYFCNTLDEARLHAASGDCVAIDPRLVRSSSDLVIPGAGTMGEMADDDLILFDD